MTGTEHSDSAKPVRSGPPDGDGYAHSLVTPAGPPRPEQSDSYIYAPQVIRRSDGLPREPEDPVDWCTTFERAEQLGQAFARNVGRGASYRVLRRRVGPWEEVKPVSQTDMYRGARNLGKRQKLVLMLLAEGARSVRHLAYAWPTRREEAVREVLKRLESRGLVDVAGWDGRARIYGLTDRGVTVERALSRDDD